MIQKIRYALIVFVSKSILFHSSKLRRDSSRATCRDNPKIQVCAYSFLALEN